MSAAGWCFCGLHWLLPGMPDLVDSSGQTHTRDGCTRRQPPPEPGKRLWFNVALCRACWDLVEPGREPHRLIGVPATCTHCAADVDSPVYVRTCWPPPPP